MSKTGLDAALLILRLANLATNIFSATCDWISVKRAEFPDFVRDSELHELGCGTRQDAFSIYIRLRGKLKMHSEVA